MRRTRQRCADIRVLWPQLLAESHDRATAEEAFLIHMKIDPAYADLSDGDRLHLIEELP